MFANHVFDKELGSRTYKEFPKLKNPIRTWLKDMKKHFARDTGVSEARGKMSNIISF